MTKIYLIDPPSPFAPIDEWRKYLADLRRIRQKTEQIKEAIAEAESHIAERD